MTDVSAVRVALSVLHLPASLRRVRDEPLPLDVATVLRIATGDHEAIQEAVAATERTPDVIRRAAVFYIEQVLFTPDATHYRVLGAQPGADITELRRNMALLMSWLHPDKDLAGDRLVLASRVTAAWDTLRNPERRAAYDQSLSERPTHQKKRSKRQTANGGNGVRRLSQGGVAPSVSRRDVQLGDAQRHILVRGLSYVRRLLRSRP